MVVRPDLDPGRSRRHDVAPAWPRRHHGLLARGQVRRAGRGRALLGGREVPRGGGRADDEGVPRALPVAARHPALRGLRAAEIRGVHAESQSAVRDPALQLQVPPGVGPSPPAPSPRREEGAGEGDFPSMRGLLPFLAQRLFRALVALWLVSTVVFVVMRLSGDPVPLLLPPDAPISEMERVRRELGLDRPLPVQYAVFLRNTLRLDFGRSIHFRQPAMAVAQSYLEATFELGLVAFAIAVVVAFPIGVVSAVKRNSLL